MSRGVCIFFARGIAGVSWTWRYLLIPWCWWRPCCLLQSLFLCLSSWGYWWRVSSFHLGCCGIGALGTLLSGIISVSVLLVCHISHLARPICIEDQFDSPGGLLRVSITMVVGFLGSYGQSLIWGWSGWIGMSILFHCLLPFLLC